MLFITQPSQVSITLTNTYYLHPLGGWCAMCDVAGRARAGVGWGPAGCRRCRCDHAPRRRTSPSRCRSTYAKIERCATCVMRHADMRRNMVVATGSLGRRHVYSVIGSVHATRKDNWTWRRRSVASRSASGQPSCQAGEH